MFPIDFPIKGQGQTAGLCTNNVAAAVAQWVRVSPPQAEGWVFESHSRQTLVVKTGSDSSTAKRECHADLRR